MRPLLRPVALLLLGVLLGSAWAQCPVTYSSKSSLLFGGLADAACSTASGAPCGRSGWWWDQCRFPAASGHFDTCTDEQRNASLAVARQLHSGAPMRLGPCDLYPFLRNRTLWLIGDSHTKQLFKSLQCFMFDFWDQQECLPDSDAARVAQLDALPVRPGESKCVHLIGDARICVIQVVLGTSLLDNPQVADGGVLNILRTKFAKPQDIFVVNFGVWHAKEGDAGMESYKTALRRLGEDYQRNKRAWPHTFFRETPMSHDKDPVKNACLPAPQGWGIDWATGKLFLQPSARASAKTLALVKGGALNEAAKDILVSYGVPILQGFAYSVPLYSAHPAMRGTPSLDCLHYCSYGLPEVLVYELARTFRRGSTGVKPMEPVDPSRRMACTPTSGAY